MANLPIGSPVRTQAIVNRYLGNAKKSLGQNFLVDLSAIQAIVEAAQIQPGDQVIEIGPGIGSLTEQLLLAGAKVMAYEVDSRLPEVLNNELPRKIGDTAIDQVFMLVMKDALQADFVSDGAGFFDFKRPVKVVANLPYYITTPLIFHLLAAFDFASLTLMMQKEVALRLNANPGTKDYGPLTISVKTKMQVDLALQVPRTAFNPSPKVDSAVVVLTPLVNQPALGDETQFNRIVKMCFAQRRKTLNNNLKPVLPDAQARLELLAQLGLDPAIRPEKLTISQFIALTHALTRA